MKLTFDSVYSTTLAFSHSAITDDYNNHALSRRFEVDVMIEMQRILNIQQPVL